MNLSERLNNLIRDVSRMSANDIVEIILQYFVGGKTVYQLSPNEMLSLIMRLPTTQPLAERVRVTKATNIRRAAGFRKALVTTLSEDAELLVSTTVDVVDGQGWSQIIDGPYSGSYVNRSSVEPSNDGVNQI